MEKKMVIGYTTGVFDMFHVGHLNILRQAKQMCDYLIVGVSTDELCVSYKHKHPVIKFDDRVSIIKSIRYVDEVVPQTDRDKFGAWNRLHFDVMFVGDDWKGSRLFSELEEQFKSVGVSIVYFPYTKGISSTELREQSVAL